MIPRPNREGSRARFGTGARQPVRRRKGPLGRRLLAESLEDRRLLATLTTGSGDGGLTVGVDGYGAFGSAVSFTEDLEAVYDPVGPIAAASTTFESGIAIRFGSSGPRTFLTSNEIGGSGDFPTVGVTASNTSATSTFHDGALQFNLLQAVAPMTDATGARTGSLLSQSYQITNTGSTSSTFELTRYLDGDLLFDGSLVDGGGRLTLSGSQFLFETDAGGSGASSTTFVGIDTAGGIVPTTGRFQISSYPGLEEDILAGATLNGAIQGDGNGDGFVDAGSEYDVTLALMNQFTLAPGASTFYSTRTVFGSGTPGSVSIATPTVNIGTDVAQLEGDSGFSNFVFPISLSQAAVSPVIVVYTTQDITATAGSDYAAQTGTLTFLPGGGTTQDIAVQVFGDLAGETNETFRVQIVQATGGILGRSAAIGTILNDDVELAVNDITVVEGNSGTSNSVFTVSVVGLANRTVSVNYTTADVTATAGSDYLPAVGTLVIPAGATSATITVPIIGDKENEATESFELRLSSPVNARLDRSVGTGTIIDTDPLPVIYVNDVQITTSGATSQYAVFTVALDIPSGRTVTVAYGTADGAAQAGVDYTPTSGTLVFLPEVTSMQVSVPVMTPAVYTPNESFYLNLFGPSLAFLGDSQGAATFVYSTPPVGNFIIDDGDPGYTQTPGWTNLTNTLAYQLDYDYHAAGTGTASATWKFTGLTAGSYQVFTKWIPFSNRATNAPYTILDGSTPLATVQVNQQLMPQGDMSNAVIWQSLGTFSTSTGTLSVRLNDNANGYVIADAVRIVAGGIAPQQPEMDVASFGHSVATGDDTPSLDDGTDFGTTSALTSSVTHTFVIANNGNAPLHLGGNPRVMVDDTDDFSVLTQPSATVAPGATTSFTLMFHPSAPGLRQATISVDNDDDTEHPYTFGVQGTGTLPGPSQLIQDDASAAGTSSGHWQESDNSFAYNGVYYSDAGGQGGDHATWTFGSLAPGTYTAYVTWIPFGNRATNAPFTVADGNVSSTTTLVNQQVAPNDLGTLGQAWKALSTLYVTSGTATITLGNQANGYVIADAVMLVRDDLPNAVIDTSTALHNSAVPDDVNGDGRITTNDALTVISGLLHGSPASTFTYGMSQPVHFCDVNGDGRVTTNDALTVISYLLRGGHAASQVTPNSTASTPVTSASTVVPAAINPGSAASSGVLSPAVVDQAVVQLTDTATTSSEPDTAPAAVTAPPATTSAPAPAATTTAPIIGLKATFATSAKPKSTSDSDPDAA